MTYEKGSPADTQSNSTKYLRPWGTSLNRIPGYKDLLMTASWWIQDDYVIESHRKPNNAIYWIGGLNCRAWCWDSLSRNDAVTRRFSLELRQNGNNSLVFKLLWANNFLQGFFRSTIKCYNGFQVKSLKAVKTGFLELRGCSHMMSGSSPPSPPCQPKSEIGLAPLLPLSLKNLK